MQKEALNALGKKETASSPAWTRAEQPSNSPRSQRPEPRRLWYVNEINISLIIPKYLKNLHDLFTLFWKQSYLQYPEKKMQLLPN